MGEYLKRDYQMGNNDTKNNLETRVNLLNKLFLGCVNWDMYEYKATGKHF